MATTDVQTVDLATLIATALAEVEGLRVCWYIADAVRPPAIVIAQPSVDYTDTLGGFCAATWTFPLTLVVPRNNDREAQLSLSRFLQEVTAALAVTPPGSPLIEPVDARPATVNVSGIELPGYGINVRIRA